MLHQVFASYRTLTAAIIALGLIVATTAFLAGPSTVAVSVRRSVTRSSWLSEHRAIFAVGVLIVAIAVVLLVNLTFGALLLVGLVVAILELVLWRLPSGPAPVPTAT